MISPATLLWCPVSFKIPGYKVKFGKTAAPNKVFWSKGNKYGAKKTVVDGITFDSKREAAYYGQLKMMKAGGLIQGFERQQKFPLFAHNGLNPVARVVIGKHIVDFIVVTREGGTEAHEVKGMETAIWRLKKKIFEANYPHIKYVVIK